MSSRQIVLDTETTGLDPAQGHRVIEVGCLELVNRRPTGRSFHRYLNPQRAIDAGAEEVHGLSDEFLADKPLFESIADDLLTFLGDAELVIHNAAFDLGFLDAEYSRLTPASKPLADRHEIIDTLITARRMHPGQRNSLDALCRRYQVDNSGRDLHGALLDARLLADVYLAMTGGQTALTLESNSSEAAETVRQLQDGILAVELPVITATDADLARHQQQLRIIDKASNGRCIWASDLSTGAPDVGE